MAFEFVVGAYNASVGGQDSGEQSCVSKICQNWPEKSCVEKTQKTCTEMISSVIRDVKMEASLNESVQGCFTEMLHSLMEKTSPSTLDLLWFFTYGIVFYCLNFFELYVFNLSI